MQPLYRVFAVVLIAGTAPRSSFAETPAMKKIVTNKASFVVYAPEGWEAAEYVAGTCRTVVVGDPANGCEATLAHAVVADDKHLELLARLWKTALPPVENVTLRSACASDNGRRIMVDGSYQRGRASRRTFRAWFCAADSAATLSRIDSPDGKFDNCKQRLLTVLSNVRMTKGAMQVRNGDSPDEPLGERRLGDGSARVLLPKSWNLHDFGACAFAASAPNEASCFIVGKVEFLTPALGVRVPGAPTSEYLPPHRALQRIATQSGLARDVRFLNVIPRADINRQIAAAYTVGTAEVEELVYTATSKSGVRTKGYTFGISFRSRLGTDWRFWHMTVSAPEEKFADRAAAFVRMMLSYRIDDDFSARYIANGIARLRELQRQTSELVARNAQEIHSMMQTAYEERQRSWDYIDYQRTNYIRGQQDWVSSLEGGRIYRSDSWGTLNSDTGAYYEGNAYDYVHFNGENPRYLETMTPIDSRALWERHLRN